MLPWFLAEYCGVRPKPVLIGSTALCMLLFFINLTQPYTLLYSEIHGIDRLLLPWGEDVLLPLATASIWGNISAVYLLFVPIFGLYLLVKRLRFDRKRSVRNMILAMALLLVTLTQAVLVRIMGLHNFPPLGMFGFLSMVIIMGMTLARELRDDQKRAEEALQDSEHKTRAILDKSFVFIGLMSPEGILLDANRTSLELIGVSPQDVFNKPFWESPWWSHSTELQNKLRESIKSAATGIEIRFEASHPTIDGNLRYVDFSLRPVKNELGAIIYLIPEGHDITERKQAEENLKESERKLTTLLGNLPGLAYRCKNDPDWTMIFMSEGCFELTGYYPKELVGNHLNSYGNLIHLDDADMVWQKVQDATNNHTLWQIEYRIHTKEGKEKWVWEQGCGVYNNAGVLEVLEGFITDITERKYAEEALTKSEEKYRYIVDNAPIGIFQRNLEGQYNYCNITLANHFECNNIDEFLENYNAIPLRWANLNKYAEYLELLMNKGKVLGFEVETKLINGKTKWFSLFTELDTSSSVLNGFSVDITERKLAEDELVQSEARLSALLSSMKDIIFEIDLDGRFEGYYAQDTKGLYIPPDFFIKKPFNEVLPLNVSKLLKEAIDNIYEGKQFEQFEYSLIIENNIQYESAIVTPRYNTSKEIIGITVVCRDITERKMNESILIKLYTAINFSKASIIITDIEGNIEFTNPFFSQITGYSKDEYLGKNPRILKSGIHSVEFYKTMWDTIKLGNTWEGELCNRKKNGELYWEKSIITPIKNEKAEIVNFVAIKSDITLEKKHKYLNDITLEIFEKAEHLTIEDILKYSIELGIKLTDSEIGFFHFVNDDQETISLQAWSAKTMDICNIPTLDKHYPISKAGVWVDCFIQKKPVIHNDYTSLSHKKGLPEGHATITRDLSVPVIIENKVVAIFGVGNKNLGYNETDAEFLSIFADSVWNIIRRKKAEIDTNKARRKAEESDHLKTQFLLNMSHEVRTPMNAINGFSSMLNKKDLSDEKRSLFTSIIISSSNQLQSIVDNILTISLLETKQEKIWLEPVCINTILSDLYATINIQAQKKQISLFVNQQLSDKQSEIYIDKTKLIQILSNLIGNALKFTHEGFVEFGYTLESNIESESDDPDKGDKIQFYIRDTGIGIEPEMQEKIFERFAQVEIGMAKQYGGNGLGLSISKGFIELLGGKIWVNSEFGKGSTFYFTIPYNPVKEIGKIV